MKRWLPYPLMAAALLVMWLLLNQSAGPGTIVLGAILVLGAVWTLTALDPPTTRFRRPGAALKLALVVLVEIVRSNNAVAWIILGNPTRNHRSGFVRVPLDTRNPYSLALLACIITATPGTIWVEYNSTDNTMLLHVLDLIDEEQWVEIVKQRYEKRLMEIFE
jgi:multicomponent K+:H+ antiporter subunit E